MRNRAVHWSEGMFLRPHHFQAADRYWSELVATSDQFDHAYFYGLTEIAINQQALANFQFELAGCRARLRDGTVVSVGGQHVDRLDLKSGIRNPEELTQVLAANETVSVFLAVPKSVEGRANVAPADGASQARSVSFDLEVDDESAGGNRQLLSFRDVNWRVLLSTDDRDGFECLPVCRLKKSPQGDAPIIDDTYFPPCLSIDAWPHLSGVVRTIYDMIGERATQISRHIKDRSIKLSSPHPGDAESVFLLSVLNEALGALSCLSFATGVHPFQAYTYLCSLIGRLAVFGSDVRAPEFPRYDHDDLAKIFYWALRQIEALLYLPPDQESFVQRFFKGAGRGMQVTLEPSWFSAGWHWFIGVNSGQMSGSDCLQLLASGKIDWKLGSTSNIDYLFQKKAQGVILHPVAQAPRQLPTHGNWTYFSIPGDNPEWQNVKQECSLGMRIKEEQIHNLRDLEGKQKIIISVDGGLVGLEFAIFAVKVGL